MGDQFDNLLRNIGLVLSVAVWVPTVAIWCILAPLFCILDVINAMTCRGEYGSLEWTFCGVRMQAHHKHVDAGGRRYP